MKYAEKFMVVPFVPKIQNSQENFILNLDGEMEKILHDKVLSKYIQSIDKFMLFDFFLNPLIKEWIQKIIKVTPFLNYVELIFNISNLVN